MLSDREHEVLEYLEQRYRQQPGIINATHRDIMQACDIKSTNSVNQYLRHLEDENKIERNEGQVGIVLVDPPKLICPHCWSPFSLDNAGVQQRENANGEGKVIRYDRNRN